MLFQFWDGLRLFRGVIRVVFLLFLGLVSFIEGLLINDTEVNVDDDLDAEDEIDGHIKPADLTAGGSGSYQVVGAWKVVQQFRALFVKRFHHSRKNRKGFVAQVSPILVSSVQVYPDSIVCSLPPFCVSFF